MNLDKETREYIKDILVVWACGALFIGLALWMFTVATNK